MGVAKESFLSEYEEGSSLSAVFPIRGMLHAQNGNGVRDEMQKSE